MVTGTFTKQDIFRILSAIPDPEIPVVSIEEMGMLRDVEITEEGYNILLTPTYTGCPAMGLIEAEIKAVLQQHHVAPAKVTTVLSPAWTTDWMSARAREKLRAYGIAPPLHSSCDTHPFGEGIVHCPRCGSDDTVVLSRFGATACKALYTCNSCREPFEYFKCH